ncbi:MAG: C25 family cysteine peptidase [candidate division WOR-3 bacterium]
MKKLILILILFLISTKVFSKSIKFNVNINEEIKNKNYNYEFSKDGDLYIQKIFDVGYNKNIKKIEYKIKSFQKNIFEGKKNNPSISLDQKGKILYEQPEDYVEIQSVASILNRKLIFVKIYPYLISKNLEQSIKEVEINVEYEDIMDKFKTSYFDYYYFEGEVKNLELLNEKSNVDLLIITKNCFINNFKTFIHISKSMGFSTEIVSVEEIYNSFSGSDEQEKIRNFVKKTYDEKGLRFLLLGGDNEIVPIRFVRSNLYYYYGDYPSDIYYGDVDGTWNKDNDHIIGETDDIEDGFLDVIVTRLPFSNENELKIILDKFENYIFKMKDTNLKNFLHCAASLLSDLSDGSGQLMTNNLLSLYDITYYNNFTLFSPLVDTFHQFPYYQGDMQLNKNSFSNKISEDFYFVNHIDHSTEYFLGTGLIETKTEYSNWDTNCFSTNDSSFSIVFSLGCSSNSFDKISVSRSFLFSKNSPVISFTGFVRTGWTGAENCMLNFWKKLLSSQTMFIAEGLIYANLNPNLYFRTAINTIGFPILPIYSNNIDSFFILEKNFNDSIFYRIVDSKGKKSGFLITIFSENRVIYRGVTDDNGCVSFPKPIDDSIIYAGIFFKDHRLKIDTIIDQKTIDVKTSLVNDTNLIMLKIKNISYSKIFIKNFKLFKDSPYLSLNDSLQNVEILPKDSIIKFLEYKRDVIKDNTIPLSINFFTVIENKKYVDSTYIHFENDSFKLIGFYIEKNYFNLSFLKNSNNYIDSFKILLKSSNQNLCIIDSIKNYMNVKKDTPIEINNIKFKYSGNNSNLDTSYIKVYFIIKNDIDSVIFRVKESDTTFSLKLLQHENGIKIYHNIYGYFCDIYKIINNENILLKKMNPEEKFYIDTNLTIEENKYFAIFYDNLNRVVDTTDIIAMNVKAKVKKTKMLIAGSYFGKLNGKSLYAKSSFNYADFNNDGKTEVIVLSDDGRVIILDENLSDITPFKLITNPYQETSPAIGDLDGNGYMDIVLANGYFKSDTSGFLILNPFSSNIKIIPIKGYGIFTSSPVLEDINNDGKNEIFIGTNTGLYVLDKDLNLIMVKNIVNVCGISVCKDIGKIFVNDYYGRIFSYDFYGNNLYGFPKLLNHLTFSPLIVSDIDNDGTNEIIVSTVDNYIFVIEENGNIKSGFPFNTNSPVYSTPRVTDIDGDGKKEILSLNKNGYINILNYKGESKATSFVGTNENYYNELLIYDFDGDLKPDIVLINNKGYIVKFTNDLKICDTILSLNSDFTSAPLVISFNNNYDYKLLTKDLSGKIYIVDNISSDYKKILFGKTLYDNQNRSYIPGEILRLNDSDKKWIEKKIDNFKVEYRLNDSKLVIFNNIYENLILNVYNISGAIVLSKTIKKSDINVYFDFKFPSGKYIYVLKSKESILKKDKIIVLKK